MESLDQGVVRFPEDLFALFDTEVYGPEPGEALDPSYLEGTLISLDLNPADKRVLSSFKRWWTHWGGQFKSI